MNKWHHNSLLIETQINRDLNKAAMDRAGFGSDKGRVLSPDEIAKLNFTQPAEIRDCRAKGVIFWR